MLLRTCRGRWLVHSSNGSRWPNSDILSWMQADRSCAPSRLPCRCHGTCARLSRRGAPVERSEPGRSPGLRLLDTPGDDQTQSTRRLTRDRKAIRSERSTTRTHRRHTMKNCFASTCWKGFHAGFVIAAMTVVAAGAAQAQSAAKTAADAAKKICAGKTITIVWEAG